MSFKEKISTTYLHLKSKSIFLRYALLFVLSLYVFFLPFEFIATINGKSIIAILGIIAIVLSTCYFVLNPRIDIKKIIFVLPFLAYILLFAVSFLFTKDKGWWFYFFKIYASNISFVFMVVILVTPKKQEIELLFVMIIATSLLASLFIFFIYSDLGGGRRTIGLFNTYIDPNYLCGIMLVAIYSLFYFVIHNYKNKVLRILLPLLGIVIFVAMFLTGSRTFIVALVLSFIIIMSYLLFFKRKYVIVAISISVLIIGYLGFYLILPEGLKYRFSIAGMLGVWETENNVGRIPIWIKSLPAFKEHPLLGWGGGSGFFITNLFYGSSVAFHNIFIESLLELGIVGFFIVLSYFVISLIFSYKNKNIYQSVLASSAFVYGFFLSAFTVKFFWFLIILSCLSYELPRLNFNKKYFLISNKKSECFEVSI